MLLPVTATPPSIIDRNSQVYINHQSDAKLQQHNRAFPIKGAPCNARFFFKTFKI